MWINFLWALVPIIWLIISLGIIGMPASRACTIGLIITIADAVLMFKQPIINTLSGALEGIIMGIWPIMYVILAALFIYQITTYSGSMGTIEKLLSSITTDKRILVLIIAWGFGGFLESIAGFGTAVAICAGILISLGLEPIQASVICLVANSTATAFGAIGLPVLTLAEVTNLNDVQLGFIVTLQLVILVILTGKSIKALKGIVFITLMSGVGMAIPQVIIAKFTGAELPALVGSLFSILVTVWLTKRKTGSVEEVENESVSEILKACSPFILVFIFVLLASSLCPPVNNFLTSVTTHLHVYLGKNPNDLPINWLSSPGTLILLAGIIGGKIQGLSLSQMFKILLNVLKTIGMTTITVCAIVGLAKVMVYAGMTKALAVALVSLLGPAYPLFAPLIGALGTFLTGSATSANVLFGNLQYSAAQSLGVSKYWIVASNMTGATAGMLSPQNIAVATGAINKEGLEGKILKETTKWGSIYLLITCVFLYLVGLITKLV